MAVPVDLPVDPATVAPVEPARAYARRHAAAGRAPLAATHSPLAARRWPRTAAPLPANRARQRGGTGYPFEVSRPATDA